MEFDLSLLVGLTGGIGSGKTLAASFFKEFGAYVLDADLICRELVEPEKPAWHEISKLFGEEVFDASGNIDRKELARIVFDDKNKKSELEKILHPRVFESEKLKYKSIHKKHPKALVIVDAALLIESGNYKNMDKVVVVDSDEKTRIKRIQTRNKMSLDEVSARMKNQMPDEEKKQYADYILKNSLDKDKFREQVKDLYAKLSLLAAENIEKTTT